MDFKFFPKDVVSGKADKVGDIFKVDNFFGKKATFRVTERKGDTIFAEYVK